MPPFPKHGAPGDECLFPVCFIEGTLEFPAPHVVWAPEGSTAPAANELIVFYPSISSTILTMWIVMAIVLIVSILMVRGSKLIPGRGQNVFEWFYEFLSDFGIGIAGAAARPYIPLFAAFFLLILFCNWSGLIPPVGRDRGAAGPDERRQHHPRARAGQLPLLRVPGLPQARHPRLWRQVLPALRVQERHRRRGSSPCSSGLVELMLEFVKPITLSMRLFGNIYGGEVALGVITALTIAFVPVGLLGLEVMLNAIQALIFSILTLMFIVLAIESHEHEEGPRRRGGDRGHPRDGAVDAPARPLTRQPRRSPPPVSMIPRRRCGE